MSPTASPTIVTESDSAIRRRAKSLMRRMSLNGIPEEALLMIFQRACDTVFTTSGGAHNPHTEAMLLGGMPVDSDSASCMGAPVLSTWMQVSAILDLHKQIGLLTQEIAVLNGRLQRKGF